MALETEHNVKNNLEKVRKNIEQACLRSGRNPEEITVIGVTKYVSIERTKEAIAAGVAHLGENRDDEFLTKYNQIEHQVNWHFIGTLQSRKVRDVVNKVVAIHSVDRLSIAKQIETRANKPVDCFVQVNVSGEQSKHGLKPKEVVPFIESLASYPNARIVGLMTMAPHTNNDDEIREVFRSLASLRDKIKNQQHRHAPCAFLSMGMSNDYEIAIEEGATHIRIGSDLVGS